MKIKENQICRLCLRIDSSEIFQEIGETIKETLEVLHLNLNSVNKEHVACSDCMGNIHKCFCFKSTCVNTENLILLFYNFESDSKLDLREVYMQTNTNKVPEGILKDQEICRLCMQLNRSSSCKPYVEIEKDILQKCIPKMNFELTKEPVFCDSCLNSLKDYFQFLQTCENTEKQIVKYCKSEATSPGCRINLNKVVQFTKNAFENERDVKVNIPDLDGLCCEIKENDAIKSETIVKEESVEFYGEHARTDIKTDVGDYIMKAEMNKESFQPHDEELDMKYEQYKSETKQSNFERFGDTATSSQAITESINMYNPRDHDPALPEVAVRNLESLDEINSYNYRNPSGVATYYCQNCPFVTEHDKSLKAHMLTHHELSEAKVFTCESCSFATKLKGNLKKHMLIHREPSEVTIYRCEKCSFVTRHEISLKRHMLTHRDLSEVPVYTCKSCAFVTKHKESLKRHMLTHQKPVEPNVYYRCESCSFVTTAKSYLHKHNKRLHQSSEIICDICSFEALYKYDLKRHMLIHQELSEVEVYKCQSCSFMTKRKGCLKAHLLTHRELSEVTIYTCESCSFVTKQKKYLKRHMLIHREIPEIRVYTCDRCSFTTKHKGSLKSHMLTHREVSEVTVYTCESCPYVTKLKGNLKKHMLTHRELSEVTVYTCESCPFTTKQKGSLKSHMLTHRELSEVPVYACESCSYVARQKGNLKSHMLTHRGLSEVTVYTCESCPFTTKHKGSLRSHTLTHRQLSEVTGYACESCSYVTRQKGNLKKHMLTHRELSEVTVYTCETCPFVTTLKEGLKLHMLTHRELSEVTV